MELDSVLSKVRGLIAKAEHESTPPDEARFCREKADAMMLKYAVDSAMLRKSEPEAERQKPGHIKMDLCEAGTPYERHIVNLASYVADFCRCKPLFIGAGLNRRDLQELNFPGRQERFQVKVDVFGFESDLKYFQILFTTLHLHIANGFDPKWDRSLSDGENAYVLHNAGLGWKRIARECYPWHPNSYSGDAADMCAKNNGSHFRAAYLKHVKKLGEEPLKLEKNADLTGTRITNYRQNFALACVSKIAQRLNEVSGARDMSTALVLRDDTDAINSLIAELYPQTKTIDWNDGLPELNAAAWKAGVKHGAAADLNASSRMSGRETPELG